ncbi:galectin-6-like [Malaya genurostris]|uniref:galectin-6-like n=1 Tax=Malaya genurostris TaxID=325434 RepID=UPI0026F3AE6B|nr:galectin-6-like [Malaya genurostris]
MTTNRMLSTILPFMEKLPTEMQPGYCIRIKGVVNRPNGDCRIQLQSGESLNSNDDIVMHLNILPVTREILHNTCCGGKWGQEERSSNSPINFNEVFELSISAEVTGFDIAINDSTFAKFEYRCPVQMARYIFINGGCLLSSVKYKNWSSVPKVISVLPSAPVYNPPASAHSPLVAFHFPTWPHNNQQYFTTMPTVFQQAGQSSIFNHSMIIPPPMLMNLPGIMHKNLDSGSTMQYKILVAVLWKICCILFKALKLIALAMAGGFGIYLLSKRLRL